MALAEWQWIRQEGSGLERMKMDKEGRVVLTGWQYIRHEGGGFERMAMDQAGRRWL